MTPKQQISKSPFTDMGLHSSLTTYDPANHPVNLSDDTDSVVIPTPKSAVQIDPTELAAVLAWAAQIEADLSK